MLWTKSKHKLIYDLQYFITFPWGFYYYSFYPSWHWLYPSTLELRHYAGLGARSDLLTLICNICTDRLIMTLPYLCTLLLQLWCVSARLWLPVLTLLAMTPRPWSPAHLRYISSSSAVHIHSSSFILWQIVVSTTVLVNVSSYPLGSGSSFTCLSPSISLCVPAS